jgi:hypothetical protein
LSEAVNGRRSAPFFRPDQIDAMHKAFEQVRTKLRLTGPKAMPVVDLSRSESSSLPMPASLTLTSSPRRWWLSSTGSGDGRQPRLALRRPAMRPPATTGLAPLPHRSRASGRRRRGCSDITAREASDRGAIERRTWSFVFNFAQTPQRQRAQTHCLKRGSMLTWCSSSSSQSPS